MELKLYHRLKTDLLGSLAPASERHDPAYQTAVEGYAPKAESGLERWASTAIQGWLERYNQLVNQPVRLRYYQILALYFTEAVLREQRENSQAPRRRLLAYWMATGSGKTLLMHLNILQYIDHIGGLRAFDELQIILTTPGVNLIEQHRREITPLIDALNRQCANRIRLTVESTGSLLNREPGFFRLPPSSRLFRLVLVDEGHIGLAGGGKETGAFKRLRHALADEPNAFLFEYSATYHGIADKHIAEYAEQIVYDYNYYRFFKDGYGKDYQLQRLGADAIAVGAEAWENFQAAFAALADKLRIHDALRLRDDSGLGFVAANADKPLIAFMGNTVEDKRKEGKGQDDEVSDIRKLLAFLAKLDPEARARLAPVFNGETTGALTLTRCPAVTDEIYLSWGDSAYWGIVNVGNGDKFWNDCAGHPELSDAHGQPLVTLRKAAIVERRFQFVDIDRPASPINVLAGSRKFAEGWNCYRVSVIGLINLGSSKGNKIIQIFGRGVRLRGLKGDGKRRFIEHVEDAAELQTDDSPENRLRRLETLDVFSLKATYLETFLKALEAELPRWVAERRVPVTAQTLRLGRTQAAFADYAAKLPIFKVGRDDSEPRLLATWSQGGWDWAYLTPDGEEQGRLGRWRIELDYRPDATADGYNLAQSLRDWVRALDGFTALSDLNRRLHGLAQGRRLQLLRALETPPDRRRLEVAEVFELVESVRYHRPWGELTFETREQLLWQTLTDALARLHRQLLQDLNKRRYRFAASLQQSTPEAPGDFISHYEVRIEFEREADKTSFETAYPAPELPEQLSLDLQEPRHLYTPLLRDRPTTPLRFRNLVISPDALNPGERQFVEDLHVFLADPVRQGRLRGFEFYLLRNVASLRSVGVYLDIEARAYFPDFVLWAVNRSRTHILLIDPKGQSGIQNWASLQEQHPKVSLAHSGDLRELADKLETETGKACRIDSFILLRKSSPLGRANGGLYDSQAVRDMEDKHVMHLNWAPARADGQRLDEDGDPLPLPPDGRCYVERMLKCAGVLR